MAAGVTAGTLDGQAITALSINIGTASTVSIVAAVAGQRVRAYKMVFTSAAAQTLTFQDGATVLTGPITVATGTPIVLPMDGNPWFVSSIGNALNILQSSAVNVSGTVWFTQNSL